MEKKFESNCLNNNVSVNSIFKQLSKTNEFKNMVNDISITMNNLNDQSDTLQDDKSSVISNNILENLLVSKNGNNICDCLENLNLTLKLLLNELIKKNN